MITIISEKQEISKLHKRFLNKLYEYFTEKYSCRVGYSGGSFNTDVYYSPNLNLWFGEQKLDNRYWNGFGHNVPVPKVSNSIIGEINFTYEGIDRQIAGVFAKDESGNILVLHRGRIGGGKPGIGKHFFINNFRGDFVTGIDGQKETVFCLVGELNSSYFPIQVSNFINEIYRIKHPSDYELLYNFKYLNNFKFTEEQFGTTETEPKGSRKVERTHGIVVNALAEELGKKGHSVANDKNRDLFVYNNNHILTLFEIKTSCSSQDLYSAVGQLIIYSIPIPNKVDLIIVLPEKLNDNVVKHLSKIGIKPLYYAWVNNIPVFERLDELLD